MSDASPPSSSTMRALAAAPLIAACALLGACGSTTEVVLKFDAQDTMPASITARLHRSTPFSDNPTKLPAFVMPALDGADLDLMITPTGSLTQISLLPFKGGPTDLKVTVTAPGFMVTPAGAQDAHFVDGQSRSLVFTLSAPLPDGGAKDAAVDGGAKDGALDGGAKDGATPDLVTKG